MSLRWKIYGSLALLLAVLAGSYALWSPGEQRLCAARHFQRNGLWLAHGWIGDASWFAKYRKDPAAYDQGAMAKLHEHVSGLKVTYLYPHLCPADVTGMIPGFEPEKLRQLRQVFPQAVILPWIGGSAESTVDLADPAWVQGFLASVRSLLAQDGIAGVHVNIEPLVSGDARFVDLLRAIKAMAGSKLLSVAAYPPPTIWHPHPEVHWDLEYEQRIAEVADQIVPMLYDTALTQRKIYTHLVYSWTRELIAVSQGKELLFGIPAYEDAGVGYHDPTVEHVANAIPGVIAGINAQDDARSFGLAFYSEWTLDAQKIRDITKFIPP
jgi:hypothetical protein